MCVVCVCLCVCVCVCVCVRACVWLHILFSDAYIFFMMYIGGYYSSGNIGDATSGFNYDKEKTIIKRNFNTVFMACQNTSIAFILI